jgi:LAS superfamily LD-carboxypeptidase LdcB
MLLFMRAAILVVCLLGGIAAAEDVDSEPRAVTGYKNGKAFKLKVVDVGWAEVEVSTARAFEKMRTAAEEDGVRLVIWSGFRTYERQAELYDRYRRGYGNLAARPGHSNHQSGRALDLMIEHGTYEKKHARHYGFAATVRGEPWHWEFVGVPRKRR